MCVRPPVVFDIIKNHARHTENACDHPQRAITLGVKSPMLYNIIKNHARHMEGVCNHV